MLIDFTPSEAAVMSGVIIHRLHDVTCPIDPNTMELIGSCINKIEAALIIHISAEESDQN